MMKHFIVRQIIKQLGTFDSFKDVDVTTLNRALNRYTMLSICFMCYGTKINENYYNIFS